MTDKVNRRLNYLILCGNCFGFLRVKFNIHIALNLFLITSELALLCLPFPMCNRNGLILIVYCMAAWYVTHIILVSDTFRFQKQNLSTSIFIYISSVKAHQHCSQ